MKLDKKNKRNIKLFILILLLFSLLFLLLVKKKNARMDLLRRADFF